MLCECADYDWRDVDQTLEHHPNCKRQVWTMTIGGKKRPTSCPCCAGYDDTRSTDDEQRDNQIIR